MKKKVRLIVFIKNSTHAVLTGFARRQSISDFLLYGADEYLAKPFQVHELLAAVDRVTANAARA